VEKVAIVGCGSLGSHLAQSLSELDEVKELVLIDHDKVEKRNLRNACFRKGDIGTYKTEAVCSSITQRRDDIVLTAVNEKFLEGQTPIPECDLVIDCRDYVYDRKGSIHVRMYMSSRYLIVDGRQDVEYAANHQGRYLHKLTKTDLRVAAFSASTLIQKGLISDIINKQLIHKIELDYLNRDIAQSMALVRRAPDEILEYQDGEKKLTNLYENLPRIKEMNQMNPVFIFVGSKDYPIVKRKIPAGSIRDSNDAIACLISSLDLPFVFNTYIVSPGCDNGCHYVELIAETGAA